MALVVRITILTLTAGYTFLGIFISLGGLERKTISADCLRGPIKKHYYLQSFGLKKH
jgi:hypothetical protein